MNPARCRRIALAALAIVTVATGAVATGGLATGARATGAMAAGPPPADGDPAAGRVVFRKCGACHSMQAGKQRVGPSLAGIVGRTAGTVEGFKYSEPMTAFGAGGATWDAANLDAYLYSPKTFIKGNRMAFPGLKLAQERADVIAYLKVAEGD